MLCVPAISLGVDKAAAPLPSGREPRLVLPTKNSTVPVGLLPVTVAVKVTDWPTSDGFRLDVSAVVVAWVVYVKRKMAPPL